MFMNFVSGLAAAMGIGSPMLKTLVDPPDSLFRFRRVEERKDIRTYFRKNGQIVGPLSVHGIAFIYEMEPYAGSTGTVTVTGPSRLVNGQTLFGAGISTDTRTPGGDQGGSYPDNDASVLTAGQLSLFGANSLRASLTSSQFDLGNPGYPREIAFVLPVSISANGGDFGTNGQISAQANWNYYTNNQGNPVLVNGTYTWDAHKVGTNYDVSVDTRKAYGQPDVEGQLPGDPNAEPAAVKFGDWVFKGGMFVGRMAPQTRDQSGTSRIQLRFPPFSWPSDGSSPYMLLMSLYGVGAPQNAPDRNWSFGIYMPNATDPFLNRNENEVTWETRWQVEAREPGYTPPSFSQVYYGNSNLPYTNYQYNLSKDPILKVLVNEHIAKSSEYISLPIAHQINPNYNWPYPDPWPSPYPNPWEWNIPGYDYWYPTAHWNFDTIFDDYYQYEQSSYYNNRWHREPGYRENGLTHFALMMLDEGHSTGYMARWLWFATKEFEAEPNAVFPHNDSRARLWYLTYRYN